MVIHENITLEKTHMKSAEMHADELRLKIFLEILLGRIAGLFYNRPMSNIKCKHHKAKCLRFYRPQSRFCLSYM